MNRCLLCEEPMKELASWEQFFKGDVDSRVCERCISILPFSKDPNRIYYYNKKMKDILHQYKFLKDIRFSYFFSKYLNEKLNKLSFDYIVPIPMHPEMEKLRTFAPIETVLKEANITYLEVLRKTTIEQQSKKTKKEREAIRPLFELVEGTYSLEGKTILLVDDLTTTGTTLRHATELLNKENVKTVKNFVFIHSKDEKR